MAARKRRKYAFVPRLLVRTAIAGVVPACALAATDGCGGAFSTASGGDGGKDAGADRYIGGGVAQDAFGLDTGVADSAFGDTAFGVAAVAYPAYESGAPETGAKDAHSDGPTDGASDAATKPDVFGVAAVAYPAYEAGTG